MFCIYFGFQLVPAATETLCLYAQLLSRSFSATSSIQNYISGVKKLHLLVGGEFPEDSFELKLAIKGLQRRNPHCPNQAAPITPDILSKIHSVMDITKPVDSVFWSLFLTAFFSLARKSNLVQNSLHRQGKQILRGDFQLHSRGMTVTFRWTKTIQFGQRSLQIPLIPISGSCLCPVAAYSNMVKLVPASPQVPAFSLPHKNTVRPVTYEDYMKALRLVIQNVGLDPSRYSTHSFRRGGATFAFKANVPGELIKTQGDWLSEAYLKYLDLSLDNRYQVAEKMRDQIISEGSER